jgi:hypothetical protein
MRTSMVSAAFLLAGAGAAALAAAEPGGNNLALNGSDTLFQVTQDVISACKTQFADFAGDGISYLGGGSGVGAGQMDIGAQQVSPMSRALKNSEYCFGTGSPVTNGPTGSSANLAEGLLVGIDGVAIAANQTNSCSGSVANGFGITTAFPALITAGDACPGCDASGNYTFGAAGSTLNSNQPSFDALSVLYFGLTHDGTFNCNSDVRKSLIKSWKNLFQTDCAAGDTTCSTGLTHAWRRSDLSGTTDAFVSVLNPPGKGIGTLPTVPVGSAQKANPFCNSADAQTAGTVSFGGSSDFSDLDPVRTPCSTTTADGICEGAMAAGGTANFRGDLGVVLPILIPDATTTTPTDLFPAQACALQCGTVAPTRAARIPSGFKCPGGSAPVAGLCFMPVTTSGDPRCTAARTFRCVDVVPRLDGRLYNQVVVVANTQVPTASRAASPFQFGVDANGRLLSGSFYRIHANAAAATNVPNSTLGETGLCQQGDDTSQIGCLTDSDPCSVGYAGREAAQAFPGPGGNPELQTLKALAVNGTPPFTPASVNSDPDLALKNLLQPTGTTPLYPLSRRLYFNTIFGFGNLQGGEKELAACYGNNTTVGPSITANGFVAIPGGVQCLDYPENLSTTSTPAPNVQGSGNVALGGCGNGSANVNACTASPPVISN